MQTIFFSNSPISFIFCYFLGISLVITYYPIFLVLIMVASAKGEKKTPRLPRNFEIAPGLSRFSAGRIYHKRGMWKKLEKPLKVHCLLLLVSSYNFRQSPPKRSHT
jgi:hypothetical protein